MPDAHMEKLGRLCYFGRTPQLQPKGCDSNAAVGGTEVALLLLSPQVPVVWARPPPGPALGCWREPLLQEGSWWGRLQGPTCRCHPTAPG